MTAHTRPYYPTSTAPGHAKTYVPGDSCAGASSIRSASAPSEEEEQSRTHMEEDSSDRLRRGDHCGEIGRAQCGVETTSMDHDIELVNPPGTVQDPAGVYSAGRGAEEQRERNAEPDDNLVSGESGESLLGFSPRGSGAVMNEAEREMLLAVVEKYYLRAA